MCVILNAVNDEVLDWLQSAEDWVRRLQQKNFVAYNAVMFAAYIPDGAVPFETVEHVFHA